MLGLVIFSFALVQTDHNEETWVWGFLLPTHAHAHNGQMQLLSPLSLSVGFAQVRDAGASSWGKCINAPGQTSK